MIRSHQFHVTLRILAAAALLAMLPIGHGWAATETPPASAPASPLAEVTVTARRLELQKRVSQFVNQIAASENGSEGLARWEAPPACPLVSGLPRQDGEYILERLTQIAIGAGVPLADENCRPNLYILVTGQPEDLLRGMEKRNRVFTFGYNPALRAETPASVVDEFIKTFSRREGLVQLRREGCMGSPAFLLPGCRFSHHFVRHESPSRGIRGRGLVQHIKI